MNTSLSLRTKSLKKCQNVTTVKKTRKKIAFWVMVSDFWVCLCRVAVTDGSPAPVLTRRPHTHAPSLYRVRWRAPRSDIAEPSSTGKHFAAAQLRAAGKQTGVTVANCRALDKIAGGNITLGAVSLSTVGVPRVCFKMPPAVTFYCVLSSLWSLIERKSF